MFDQRSGLPYALLLLGLAVPLGLSGPVLAQSGAAVQFAGSAYQVAQYSNTVLELQRELNRLGFDAGPVDGLMGARTRSAIQAYQRDNQLLVDGQPTSSLLSHVRATAQGRTPAPAASRSELSSQQVADIQEALRGLGYTTGRASGRLDDETRAAIRSYESDHSLLMSGEPSTELLRHMRERAEAATAVTSGPVDANTLARIQSELRVRGYPIPLISGRMDAPTRQAIREYQQGQGVPVTGEPYSHIELGPYRGNGLNHGYRLSHRGDQPLQLIFTDERGTSVIASARYRLENSVPQRLIWQRDAEGRMTVTRDDEVLIDVVDRKMSDGFDGFSLINAGGEWTLHELIVEDRS